MSRVEHAGISFELEPGWEVTTTGGGFAVLPSGAREPTVIHIASFPLPHNGASFGADAVPLMGSSDVLIVLFEYGPEAVGTAPFTSVGVPKSLQARQFERSSLQRAIAGQTGMQTFFTENGRAFCLYVVLGSHIDRVDLVPQVNRILDTMVID